MTRTKSVMAALLVLFLIVGLTPIVFAQDSSAGTDVLVKTGVDEDKALIDARVQPQSKEWKDSKSKRETARGLIDAATKERKERREKIKTEREAKGEEHLADMKDKFQSIRANQKARIESALSHCSQAPDPSKCTANLQERLAHVTDLQDKDLELLTKLKEKRSKREESLAKIGASKALAHYREEGARARLVSREKIEQAKKGFQEAKEKEQEARKRFHDQKEEVNDLRKKVKESCKENKDSDECKKARFEVVAKAKASLLDAADAALETLAKIQAKMSESEDLTDSEESDLKAKMEARVSAIAKAKVNIQSIGSDTPTADVEAEVKALRKEISEAKDQARGLGQFLVSSRMGGVIVRSKHLEERLNAVLEKGAEKGKEVSSVDSKVDEFHNQLEIAASAHQEARSKLLAGDIQAGQESMKKAKQALDKAHELVKEIFQILKAQGLEEELQSQDIEAQVKAGETVQAAAGGEGQ